MCELFKSDRSPLKKKYWRKLKTACPYRFLRVKVFANFNTWAQEFSFHPFNIEADFSFIPSLKSAPTAVLGLVNWCSFEAVVFALRICLKLMFLFQIMWFLQNDFCEGDFPKTCNVSLSQNIQMIWVASSKTVWLFGCKEIARIIAYLKKAKNIDNTKQDFRLW